MVLASFSVLIVFRISEVDLKLCKGAVRLRGGSFLDALCVGEGERSMVIFVVVVVLLQSRFVVVFEQTVCFEFVSSRPIRTTSPLFKTLFLPSGSVRKIALQHQLDRLRKLC